MPDPTRRTKRKEAELIGRAAHNPGVIRQVNKILSDTGQPILHAQDFSLQIDRELFLLINDKQSAGEVVPSGDMWDSLDDILSERLKEIGQSISAIDKKPSRNLALSVLQWRLEKKKLLNTELQQMLRTARSNGESESLEQLAQQVERLTVEIKQIDRAKMGLSSRSKHRYAHKW